MVTIAPETNYESRIHRMAANLGYRITNRRERATARRLDNFGEFQLVENSTNAAVLGIRYDATLGDIEEFLTEERRKTRMMH